MLIVKNVLCMKVLKLWNSISNGMKTIENISEFKMLLKNGMELLAYVKIVSFAP